MTPQRLDLEARHAALAPCLAALAPRLAALGPWSRRVVAFAAGLVSVLSLAPFFLWPVLFATMPVLVWLIDAAVAGLPPRRAAARAAAVGWWFAFGYFLAGLFWIGDAFLVEAEQFAVLMPFAVLVLPAGLALFWAAATAAAALAWAPGWRRLLVLALALSLAEWLRGHILTGFPWNVLGYALTAPSTLMQSASVLGIYGLTLVAVLVFSAPLVVWQDARAGRASPRAPLVGLLLAVAPLAAMIAWGVFRLTAPAPEPQQHVRLRLVQPSIPQREKWQRENQRANFERHLDLTVQNAAGQRDDARGIDLIVWPEAAMPFLPLDVPAALHRIAGVVPPGAHLVAGILRVEPPPANQPGRLRRVLNSLAVLGSDGRPAAIYDKTHLVPFGEYLPFQATLEAIGLEQLTRIRGGFDIGPSPRPLLRIPGLPPLAPLICYEVIFPADVVAPGERPRALLNLTNDGWFGDTTGPRQHFHQSRVRAVEEGMPLIRAANNGISAVVDAYGRIIARIPLDVAAVADADLPSSIAPPLYARFGDGIFAALWIAGLIVAALGHRGRFYSRLTDEISKDDQASLQ